MIRLTITVEQCIDDEQQWVWSLLAPDGGVYMDGYAGSEAEACIDARDARRDVYAEWSEYASR